MDYEKKYKEALSRARQFSEHPLLEDSSNIVEYIFPELDASEDDRIRKEIIYHIQNCDDTIDEVTEKRMLTWLEKQGESKFEQCTQEGDKIVTNEDGTRFNVSQLERVVKKEPKKVEDETLVIDEGKAEMDYCFTKMMNGEKVSSAWSEEDENKVTLFMQLTEGCDNEDELADWLKSLKERIKPQWKPSEEQLKALNTMNVTGCITEVGQGKSLVELYEQLKKLREE